jgi:uncharacterized damage-inducible protein DinB
MQIKDMLIKGWDEAYDVEGWYPPLKAALNDLSDGEASWRPEGDASHTIAELVIHLLYYKQRFLHRLEAKAWTAKINTNDESFSAMADVTPSDWYRAVDELQAVHRNIRKKLNEIKESDLDALLPEAPIGEQFFTLITHDAYHTGQIILIRKLQGTWPAFRDT